MSFLSRLLRGHKHDSALSIVPETVPEMIPTVENVTASLMPKSFIRKKASAVNKMNRICRLEELEKRELLAVDPTITLGGAILEQNEDVEMGDRFYLSWVTDVSDTSVAMQEVTFELGREDGWAYAFFDTTSDPPNGGNYDTGNDIFIVSPYSDISEDDFDYYFTYEDGHTDKVGNGATSLTITFFNNVFTTGKKLVFEVDVDFVNVDIGGTMTNPTYEYYSTSNFEGKDMEAAGVNFTAKFTSDQYEDLEATLYYKDIYDVGGRLDIVEDISDDPFTDGGLLTSGVVEAITLTPKPVEISGYVYADVVWDCYYKPADGDYALAGVEMNLYYQNEEGNFVEYCVDGKAVSTLTDANGYYEFNALPPGTYQVHCEGNIPYGEVYGEEIAYYDKCARSQNNPVSSDPLVLTTDELVGGSSSVQNNFGKVLWGTIAGNVYEDRNLSGEFDAGDAGIAGVTVELYRMVNGEYVIERSTLTDADGSYHFNNLTYNIDPETGKYDLNTLYAIHEVQPSGYVNAKNNVGYLRETGETSGELVKDTSYSADNRLFETISVPCFMNGVEYNFGEVKVFSVSGYVYEDLDYSGKMSTGDARIANVKVELYKGTGSAMTLVAETYTNSTGYYEFVNLSLGETYYIHEVQPSEYINAENNVGTISGETYGSIETLAQYSDDSRLFKIDLSARPGYGWEEEGVQYNFGENRVAVSGYVYEDRDSSDTRSVGDPGIADTRVELYKKVGSTYVYISSVQTDAEGFYKFENLDVDGEYYIHEVQPNGYINRTNTVGSFNDESLGSIVTMTSYGDDVRVFSLNLNAADKSDWVPGETGVEYNFGETIYGSISGYVYQDRNDSGIKDTGDAPISNVTIELYKWNGIDYEYVTETKTDSTGFYLFDDLDINEEYAVHEVQPSESENRSNNLGTIAGSTVGKLVTDTSYADDNRIFEEIALTWAGNTAVQYNFGEIKYGSISGYVYDVTSGQVPISGVTITLVQENGTTLTQTTDTNGYYIFTGLQANKTYTVQEQDLSATYTHYGESVGNFNGEKIGTSSTRILSSITIPWDDSHNSAGDQDGVQYNFMEYIESEPEKPEGFQPDKEIPLILPSRYYGSPTSPFNYLPDSVSTTPISEVRYGGGGFTPAYSWHLSVLNGGYPRSIEAQTSVANWRRHFGRDEFSLVSWSAEDMSVGQWIVYNPNGDQTYQVGADGAIAVAGDWNGDGTDEIGFYVNGFWFLDLNGNNQWDDDDLWAELGGRAKDQPVSGDWDGDGKADIGIFGPRWEGDELAVDLEAGLPAAKNPNTFQNVSRPKNVPPEYQEVNVEVRTMRQSTAGTDRVDLVDHVFQYGHEGDRAVTGDWNGDGISKVGVYNNGKWRIDVNGNGVWDEGDREITGFGNKNSIPVVGDFNGDGVDEIGLFESGLWSVDTDGDSKPDKTFEFGQEGDQPVVGDFNGDGTAEFSVYRNGAVETETISTDTDTDI